MRKKIIILLAMLCPLLSYPQQKGWQHMDLKQDSIFGISTNKAYNELLKGKKAKTVIVAVLDGGTDTAHLNLRHVIWTNPGEKAGNGKDDDHNGCIDDIHGWDFIGGPKGDVQYDNIELTRLVRRGDSATDPKLANDFNRKLSEAKSTYSGVSNYRRILDTVLKGIGKSEPLPSDFSNFPAKGRGQIYVCQTMAKLLEKSSLASIRKDQIDGVLVYWKNKLDYQLNPDFDPRPMVGDNYNDQGQHFYGNNDVMGPDAHHGTHVAGIIAADRTIDTASIKGIADHVQLMIIRAIPDGDERDKDVANGIRYAVANGAKIINMSFGKAYSWDKGIVDSAVRFAMAHNVLLVQAAGNESADIDTIGHYPNPVYKDGGRAAAWIVVGASGWKNDSSLCAPFSNYGQNSVDVFAPGVHIYSTIPGNQYAWFDGTSMAAPIVSGLAALIWEYYPKLTALQVKDIILKSVVKSAHLARKCSTGGVVNAYNALQLAEAYYKK
jgi:subtilisin family serine protease